MKLHYGTSSWSEKSWKGSFYPKNIAPADMLKYYSDHFNSVEADVTYYRIPSEQMVKNWHKRSPDHFILSAKFPRSIVHAGEDRLPDSKRLLNLDVIGDDCHNFLNVMSNLKEKCGPMILQFPYFNKKVFASPTPFFKKLNDFLSSLPNTFRYGVEIRNRHWINRDLIEILNAHATSLVWVDIPYMPFPDAFPKMVNTVTGNFLYVRLIGDRKALEAKTKTFDRIVVDKTKSLRKWAQIIHNELNKVDDIFVYANNHYAGHGPATIRQIVSLLQDL